MTIVPAPFDMLGIIAAGFFVVIGISLVVFWIRLLLKPDAGGLIAVAITSGFYAAIAVLVLAALDAG